MQARARWQQASSRACLALVLALSALAAGDAHAGGGKRARGSRAAIDIGSSGIKLLVVNRKGRVVADEKIGASLGKAIGSDRLLPHANQKRAEKALGLLAGRAREYGVKRRDIEVIATAAVRNADGKVTPAARSERKMTGRAFIDRKVRSKRGLGLKRTRILTDQKEAVYGYKGALLGRKTSPNERLVVIDTGGGSHQVIAGTGPRIQAAGSTQIGSNYVAENVLVDGKGRQLDAVTEEDLAAADRRIATAVPELPIGTAHVRGATLVVTGGVSKFLYHYFRKDVVTRDEIAALRQRVGAVPARDRGPILKRDIHGKKLSGREKRLLGLHEEGSAAGSYGRKVPAKLTLLLHLMSLAGSDVLELSQTDARHVLVD